MKKTESIDFDKLLGFETVGAELARCRDFQEETFSDKLGAKVGVEVGDGITHFQKPEGDDWLNLIKA